MIDEIKAALRRERRAIRRLLFAELTDAADAAAQWFVEAWRSKRLPAPVACAAVYDAMGSEMDAMPLAVELAALGVNVAVPEVVRPDQALAFRVVPDKDIGRSDVVGFGPPRGNWALAPRPDLVFTPLLAFDRRGGRLGQGKGFYDRTLAGLRTQGSVLAIGLGYGGQEVEAAPMDEHDQRLDGVLTERGLQMFTKGS